MNLVSAPRYKIVKYNNPEGLCWGISKRFLLLPYKPLIHSKVVWVGCESTSSLEILTFSSEEIAEDEVDRLYFGGQPITKRVWKDGKLVKESYK